MATHQFTAIAGLERLYSRTEGGPTETPPGFCQDWPDFSGNADTAFLLDSLDPPAYVVDPLGNGTGPAADCQLNLGFGQTFVGGVSWTVGVCVEFDAFVGVQNIVCNSIGTDFALFFNGTQLRILDGVTTENVTFAPSTGVVNRFVLKRRSVDYRLYHNGTLIHTTTTIIPTATPTFCLSGFGGSGSPMDGRIFTWCVYSSSLDDIGEVTALDVALLDEITAGLFVPGGVVAVTDAARFGITVTDAARFGVTVTDAARFGVTVTDRD